MYVRIDSVHARAQHVCHHTCMGARRHVHAHIYNVFIIMRNIRLSLRAHTIQLRAINADNCCAMH